jgi:hypothetical protein
MGAVTFARIGDTMGMMREKMQMALAVIVVPAVAGTLLSITCSDDSSFGGDGDSDSDTDTDSDSDDLLSLTIEPQDATLVVVDGEIQQQAYSVTGEYEGGATVDLTDEVVFGLSDGKIGDFDGSLLTTSDSVGGHSVVSAQFGEIIAEAQVTVVIQSIFIGEGVPDGVEELFDGADDPARAPTITYPADGVLLPPNLGDVGFFWDGGAGNDVWRARFQGEYSTIDVYLVATSYVPVELPWEQLIPANGGLEPVQLTVSGTAASDPATVGTSEPLAYAVAEESVEGGVYYWAASSTVGLDYGIYRFDFGKPEVAAQQAYTTVETEGRCVACHALRHDGTAMTVNYDGGDGPADLISVADQASILEEGNAYFANFQTFSPDDAYLLTVYQGIFTLRDGDTAAPIEALPLTYVTYPDWSLDGEKIAFTRCTRPAEGYSDWAFRGGQIEIMAYDGPGGWSEPEVLVPAEVADVNYYYPAISPDGEWVIFNRSTESDVDLAAGDSYSDNDATLRAIGMDGENNLALERVNLTGDLRTSWAKWCPFVYEYKGEPVMWFTFSSMRKYGNLLADGQNPQLWMAAFSPALAEEGEDPSWPAFYLPFQDITTNNHIAQWTEVVVDLR